MVTCGLIMITIFALGLILALRDTLLSNPLFLRIAVLVLPLPWIANELGWIVTEVGRQPWTIYGVLPVHLSVSSLSAGEVFGSLAGFGLLYTALLIVELWLMAKYAGTGPSSLGTGRYFHEQN